MMNLIWKLDAWLADKKRLHDIMHSFFFLSIMLVALAFGATWSSAFAYALCWVVIKELLFDPITLARVQKRGWYKFEKDNVFDIITYLQPGVPAALASQGDYFGAVFSFAGLAVLWLGFKKYRADQI